MSEPAIRVEALAANPFDRGRKVVIPAGTRFRSMNPRIDGWQQTKVKQTVTAHMVSGGYINYDHGRLYFAEATVTTAGGGGYWKDMVVDTAMLEANGHDLEPVFWLVEPSTGPLDLEAPGWRLAEADLDDLKSQALNRLTERLAAHP